MSIYLVAEITVHDPDQYQEYARQVPAFIEKYSGTYCIRGGEVISQEGDWQPQRLIVIKFPSKQHATAFLEDPGYQPVAEIRHRAATTKMVLAEGFEPGG
jgi:uncharacterized protein (DUF1330 family)